MKSSSLQDKSKAFALRIIHLYSYLREEKSEYVMSRQILRSGTSIGANIAESCFAQSDADFLTKLTISAKEANETSYWLDLLCESQILSKEQYESLNVDCVELLKLLTSSIKTIRTKITSTKE